MNNKDFVHLHAHTHVSMQDALPTPSQYAMKAREMGFKATALTDHGRMGGIVEFVDACRKPNGDLAPIKPLIGIEVYTCKDRNDKSKQLNVDTGEMGREKYNHLTLIAKNETGYRNLLKLSSLGHESFYYFPRVDWELIQQYSKGVIACSGCMGGELCQTLIRNGDADKVVQKFYETFGEDYHIEYQYHGIEEQKRLLPQLRNLAQKYNIKAIASNDVHYLKAEDWKLHDLLISMRDMAEDKKEKTNGKKEAYGSHQFYLKNYEEMGIIFNKFAPEALTNTVMLAEKVEDFMKIDIAPFLPKAIIPTEDTDFRTFWQKIVPYNQPNEAYLAYLTMTGLKKLGLGNNQQYVERLKSELRTIWYSGVTDYFLIQYETCLFMKSNDIMFGIRGSGVGSLVNHCLGICAVDPLRWGLMFERFLNPGRGTQYKIEYSCLPVKKWQEENKNRDQSVEIERVTQLIKDKKSQEEFREYSADITKEVWLLENQSMTAYLCDIADQGLKSEDNESQLWVAYFLGITDKMPIGNMIVSRVATLPDIDTDISSENREQVIAWTKERFGEDCVAQIGTRGTYKARSAVQCALKVSPKFNKQFGANTHYQAQEISKTIPSRQAPPMTIEDALEESQEFLAWAKKFPDEVKMASQIAGTIQHLGIHAGGILISNQPITNATPLENSKGILCSGYDMSSVERVGLVKYDFLGVKAYTAIANALKLIEQRHGKKINLEKLPVDDPKVFKIYHEGKTSTVFQCAGDGMVKQALQPIRIEKFEDIIAVVALYRPGPKEYIPEYAAGMKNPGSIKFSHELLEKHLGPTYGIIIYQEQAMFLAREMAQLNWNEVDKLRKAISKKKGDDFIAICKVFETKALARGVPKKAVDEVLHLMDKFAGYAFNRCLEAGTLLTNANTGEMITIKEAYDTQKKFNIHTLNINNLKVENSLISDIIYNGVKPVWKLTTKQGFKIKTTANHPFYTIDGWKNLEDLQNGEYIGISRHINVNTSKTWNKNHLIVLAGLLSEGNTCHPSTLYFYNKNQEFINDFVQASQCFGNTKHKIIERENKTFVISLNTGIIGTQKCSDVYQWAKELGITYKKATEKFIPKDIFLLNNEDIALFIGRMWSGDGFINNNTNHIPFYATSSKQLAEDMHYLLLRLGIISGIHTKKFKYRNQYKVGYTILLLGDESRNNFIKQVFPHIIGRDTKIEDIKRYHENKNPNSNTCIDLIPVKINRIIEHEKQISGMTWKQLRHESEIDIRNYGHIKHIKKGFRRSTLNKIANYFNNKELINYANSDIYWDTVVSIEYVGEEPTYDITVDPHHNFVANGFIVHNSHATGYALTSYWTAWLRRYYPHEWMAANMQIDHDDEEKMARYKRECRNDNIIIIQPNINDSTLNTTVTSDNRIALPLTTIKGVGEMAKVIVEQRPYEDLKDLCFRAKPNRGLIENLANGKALECLSDVNKMDVETIMMTWDNLVIERKQAEKKAAQLSKQKFHHITSVMSEMNDNIVVPIVPKKKKSMFSDDLLKDW